MSLAIAELIDLSRSITDELAGALRVAAVTATEGGTDRAEILLTIEGCHAGPCQVMVNVTRSDRSACEQELRAKLHAALSKHTGM